MDVDFFRFRVQGSTTLSVGRLNFIFTYRYMKLISVKPSSKSTKKYDAKFLIDGKDKVTSFGAQGFEDYTIHKDIRRRDNYRARHKNDNLNDATSPGALSWYILWGESTSFNENIRAFKRRFKL